MKRKHAGAKSRKHGCHRCGAHKSVMLTLARKSGRLYALCMCCAKSVGKVA